MSVHEMHHDTAPLTVVAGLHYYAPPAVPMTLESPLSKPGYQHWETVTFTSPYPVWDSLVTDLGFIGIQPCRGCGTVYADDLTAREDDLLNATRHSARHAGWRQNADFEWRCPDCQDTEAKQLAERAAQIQAEVDEEYEQYLGMHVAVMGWDDRHTARLHRAWLRVQDGRAPEELEQAPEPAAEPEAETAA